MVDLIPEELFGAYMRGMEFRAIVDAGYKPGDLNWVREVRPENEFRMMMFLRIKDRTLGVVDVRSVDSKKIMIETRWMADA